MTYKDLALIEQGINGFGSAFKQWQRDKNANDIMTALQQPLRATPVSGPDPGTGGLPDYPAYTGGFDKTVLENQLDLAPLKRQLVESQIRKNLAYGGYGHGRAPDPYADAKLKIQQQNADTRAANVDSLTRQREKGPASGATRFAQHQALQDEADAQNLQAELDVHKQHRAQELNANVANGVEDAPYSQQSEIDKLQTKLEAIQARRAMRQQQGGGDSSTATQKQLDKQTAASILQETGGDKDQARELARQRGYTF